MEKELLYPDRRFVILSNLFLAIALLGTTLSVYVILTHYGAPNNFVVPGVGQPPASQSLLVSVIRTVPIPLSIVSWVALAGVFFIWRGRRRSTWLKLGFDQDDFELRKNVGSTHSVETASESVQSERQSTACRGSWHRLESGSQTRPTSRKIWLCQREVN